MSTNKNLIKVGYCGDSLYDKVTRTTYIITHDCNKENYNLSVVQNGNVIKELPLPTTHPYTLEDIKTLVKDK